MRARLLATLLAIFVCAACRAADTNATRPDYLYLGVNAAPYAFSSDAKTLYVALHEPGGPPFSAYDLATGQSTAVPLPAIAGSYGISAYAPASNLMLLSRSSGSGSTLTFRTEVLDLTTGAILPLAGPYVVDGGVPQAATSIQATFNSADPAGRRFPTYSRTTRADGSVVSFVAVIDTTTSPARVRACGSPFIVNGNAAIGDSTGIVGYDAASNVVFVNTLAFGSPGNSTPVFGLLDCNTDDIERRATPLSFLDEFANASIAPRPGNRRDEYAFLSVDQRIAVSYGGYVVDRVLRKVLALPSVSGADALHEVVPKALSRDGRYALMQRQKYGTTDQEVAVTMIDTASGRGAAFVLSRAQQPLVAFSGGSYLFSDDGSKVSFRGGGVDFITLPPGTVAIQVPLVACNPFVCDALPSVARPSVPITTKTLLSDDGRFAFFDSAANLVADDRNNVADVMRLDRASGEVIALSRDASGALLAAGAHAPSINSDGTLVAFDAPVSTTAGAPTDVLVKDAISGALTRMSQLLGLNPATTPLFDAALSGNGKFAAFAARASGLAPGDANGHVNVYRVDLGTREVVLGSAGANADCSHPALSRDGAVLAFDCTSVGGALKAASADTTQTMLYDLLQKKLELVAHGASGPTEAANAASRLLGMSADGTSVLFSSSASNVVANDTNAETDLFLYRRDSAAVTQLSVSSSGGGLDAAVAGGTLSGDGKAFAFSSTATNIDPLGVAGNNALYLGSTDGGPIRQVRRGLEGAVTASSTLAALNFTGSDVVFSNDGSNGSGGAQEKAGVANLLAANNPSVGTDSLSVSSQFAGLWYNLAQSGHGFLVELTESNGVPTVIVSWYVYLNGAQRWLLGSAPLRAGGVSVPMFITRGPSFSPMYDASQLVLEPWGVLTMKFLAPNQGLFAWASSYPGFGSGQLKVDRLTSAAEPKSDRAGEMPSCASGTWYDPAQSGQGFQVEKLDGNPAQLAVLWYSYDRGQQYWLIGTGPIVGNRATVSLVNTRGGQFPPFFNPASVQQTPWGSLTFTFNGGDSAQVAWTPTAAGFAAGTMSLTRLSLLSARPCR